MAPDERSRPAGNRAAMNQDADGIGLVSTLPDIADVITKGERGASRGQRAELEAAGASS